MYLLVKRYFDFLIALIALVCLFPLLFFVSLLIKFDSKGPIFFRQQRTGKNGKIFGIYKFRTMKIERFDDNGRELSDFERLTPLGRLIRGWSIDELPQLINILKGEMSLIGPRPLLPEYLPYYSPSQMQRHGVLPGITGWAQVNGRNAASWDEKFEYDVWYVEHFSLILDIKIMYLTAKTVLARKGINQSAGNTMERFDEYAIKRQVINGGK
jgi:lipopolysaccharide/colanic/teichoic acid biosynthesis glycosyltransferase